MASCNGPRTHRNEELREGDYTCNPVVVRVGWAGEGSHPADYNVDVQVSSSSIDRAGHQVLDVVIHSKKYELRSELPIGKLLALGDYKAKLVKNDHPTAYDSSQVYEFLFPDKTRPYVVVGQTE